MSSTYRRAITAELANLARLHDELAEFLRRWNVPSKASHDAQMVVDELVGNSIRHGLGADAGASHRIEVAVTLGDAIAIEIRDDLRPFDPTSRPPSPPATSIAAAPIGGRGIAMVRRASTRFRWREERGGNAIDVEIPLRSDR